MWKKVEIRERKDFRVFSFGRIYEKRDDDDDDEKKKSYQKTGCQGFMQLLRVERFSLMLFLRDNCRFLCNCDLDKCIKWIVVLIFGWNYR